MKSLFQLITVFLISVFASTLNAQKLEFGLQSGLNLSNTHVFNKDDFTDQTRIFYPLVLLNGHAYIGYKSESFWGFSFEPGFIQKGGLRKDVWITTENTMYQPQDVKYISNFIQLPVLTDVFFTDRFFISFGPEFSIFLNSKAKGEFLTFNSSAENDKFEVSGILSVNYSPFKFMDLGLRYNHGITSPSYLIWVDDFGNYVGRSKQFNQYFQFTLRFKKNWR